MAILTFILIIICVLMAYFTGKRKFLSPWFLLCAFTLFTFTIMLLNYKNWDLRVNGRFTLYIITALLSFGLGTFFINLTGKNTVTVETKLSLSQVQYKRIYPVNTFLVLSIICVSIYVGKLYYDVYDPNFSFTHTLRNIYELRNAEDYSPGFIFNQMSEVVRAIAYINTFRLFLKIFNNTAKLRRDKVSYIKLILPILIMLVMTVICTDRNIFIRYGIYFICLWMFFYYNNCKSRFVNIRIISMVLVFAVLFFIVFFIMGKMKEYTSDITRVFSIYGGSGLNNFNIWIGDFNEDLKFGQATFTQLITTFGTFLKPFGIKLQGTVDRVDPFIEFTSSNGYIYSSNIYTALKPFVEDFGYLGVIIFPFIMGLFYQWLYKKAEGSKYGLVWLCYCILIYPIIFFPILEQLFKRFHLGFIYEIVWPLILYYIVFGRKKFKVVKGRTTAQIKGAQ